MQICSCCDQTTLRWRHVKLLSALNNSDVDVILSLVFHDHDQSNETAMSEKRYGGSQASSALSAKHDEDFIAHAFVYRNCTKENAHVLDRKVSC